ncbi:DUF4267 domain-containing protein [Streptomyces sp. CL12-4]|uniref:DUF4267 domain-containing protein n=1 Tax=Streptomyces sp. CL12-4 TaxID=2810306 RepID=UPI0035ABB326
MPAPARGPAGEPAGSSARAARSACDRRRPGRWRRPGQRRALGWIVLMVAAAPFGDMITVLDHHGSLSAAFGIHGLTSAFIATTGLLILRETSKARNPAPAVQPA